MRNLDLNIIRVEKIFTGDADISIPPAPSVRAPVPLIAMLAEAPATLRPPHEVALPSVRPAPSEPLFQYARLDDVGTAPPDQLVLILRLVPLPALATGDAAVAVNVTGLPDNPAALAVIV